jgi:hypothetical protein
MVLLRRLEEDLQAWRLHGTTTEFVAPLYRSRDNRFLAGPDSRKTRRRPASMHRHQGGRLLDVRRQDGPGNVASTALTVRPSAMLW